MEKGGEKLKLNYRIKNQIKESALSRIRQLKIEKQTNLHIHDEVLPKGQILRIAGLSVPIERETGFVFVDNAPQFNWAHPCEYQLYDAQTGKLYNKVLASLPPPQIALNEETAFHTPVAMVDTKKLRESWKKRIPPFTNALSAAPGQRYAILFAGKAENRHTNDLEFLYRTLIDVYDFNVANILVLNHDGTVNYFTGNNTSHTIGANLGNWPGNNSAYRIQVTGAGTRAGFQAALNTIAGQIQPEDFLFIHTNNHGGGPCDLGVNDYCMFVYEVNGNWVPYYVNDFIADLGVLPHFEVLMVMMEQCRSGGFINPIINNSPATWTQVSTAVNQNDYSLGGNNFDPFAEDWIAGINGSYADGTGLAQAVDSNNDGRISANEAFNYANAVVHYNGSIQRHCPEPNGTPLRLGDTPTQSASPSSCGSYIFLGLPAHDLYIRDNLEDHGREPLISGGISCSPDIIVYNQELLDPEATLGTPEAQQSDTLGSSVEHGQDNFIYLRIQNRGTQAASGTATVYYSTASTLPSPNAWTQIENPIVVPAIAPNEMKIVGPIVWKKGDIPAKGHYCFIALISSGDDPAPDPASVHNLNDYYHFIRQSNNATWKNFNVVDLFANSITNMTFVIQGWPQLKLAADLMIDLTKLPTNMQVKLKVLKRLTSATSLENAILEKETSIYQYFDLAASKQVFLRNLDLKASDYSQANLQITVPDVTPDGNYRLAVAQIVDGKEMGRVTQMLAIGVYPYMANRRTLEIHVSDCDWAAKISNKNKEAFQDLQVALKRGFDGCHYCLRKYSKD